MIKKMIVLLGLLCGFSMHAAELARMKARSEEKQSKTAYNTKHLKFIEDTYNPDMTDEQRKSNQRARLYPHFNFQQVIRQYYQRGVAKKDILSQSEFFLRAEQHYAEQELRQRQSLTAEDLARIQEEKYIVDINNQLKQQEKTRIAQQDMSASSCKDSEVARYFYGRSLKF